MAKMHTKKGGLGSHPVMLFPEFPASGLWTLVRDRIGSGGGHERKREQDELKHRRLR